MKYRRDGAQYTPVSFANGGSIRCLFYAFVMKFEWMLTKAFVLPSEEVKSILNIWLIASTACQDTDVANRPASAP
ncbi:hypothetical protein D3C86_2016620 [compost metagenome]